ncbi:MAG TPA: hypothetical protein VES68_03015 [Candidatus Sulfotelmatobacter sp.]|nr:hypothetical protein [Candidatus Sulfotelmatobacter sp.]
MKKVIFILFLFLIFFVKSSYAIYDPLEKPNNKFGIHILYTSEISEASSLINSSGGDWGYVTIPIQSSDRDLIKWQKFMDDCKAYHVIPIIRIATSGDYFSKSSWSKPTDYDVLDFANFLDNLSWPTRNRYVVIFNEENRGDEWGGTPSASEYAEILNYAIDIFKEKNKDFFVIMGGLDNASANIFGSSINNYSFMEQMDEQSPGIFSKLDGIASHSYPNPAFSSPPSYSREGVYSFFYQKELADSLANKSLPIFITETGWSSNFVSPAQQVDYYGISFSKFWNDKNIVAITPFLFHSDQGSFSQFSFIKNSNKEKIYYAYEGLSKIKGEPELSFNPKDINKPNPSIPIENFPQNEKINNVFNSVNKSSRDFFKWLLKI